MNSEQLRLFMNGAFGSEEQAREMVKKLQPNLVDLLRRVRERISLLPDESLTRQQEWKAALPEIEEMIRPYNDAFAVTLTDDLPASGIRAAEETTLQLKSIVPRTAGLVPPEVVMADSTKYLLNTKINDRRILDFFLSEDVNSITPFMKSNRRMIDMIVTGGIIEGKSTADIAEMIFPEIGGREPRYIGTKAAKRLKNQADAVARTAIQDYNRQVKEAVWEANEEVYKELGFQYEWVAALDSRTCPICAPKDGAVYPSKSRFGVDAPAHVNCRCQIVLIDPKDKDDPRSRYGQLASETPTKGQPGGYASKKKVKGDNLFRQNREFAPKDGEPVTYATFLADLARKSKGLSAADLRKSAVTHKRGLAPEALTLRQFFGSNKKTEQFIKWINSGNYSPDNALKRIFD